MADITGETGDRRELAQRGVLTHEQEVTRRGAEGADIADVGHCRCTLEAAVHDALDDADRGRLRRRGGTGRQCAGIEQLEGRRDGATHRCGIDVRRLVQEPGLVTHLLKMVNSAFYARPQKVDSIQQTIVILGMNTVRSIASGLVMINSFDNLSGVSKNYLQSIFEHSIISANMMNIFAGKESIKKREPLYLAAMVHDMGRLILAQYFGEAYMNITKEDLLPPIERENEMFEVNHSALGCELLDEWKFPDDVISIVRCHHNPETYEGDEKDIYYLRTCTFISKQVNCLEEFLSQDKEKVEDEFLLFLDRIDWDWSMVLENKEKIFQAVDLAKLLMS